MKKRAVHVWDDRSPIEENKSNKEKELKMNTQRFQNIQIFHLAI